MTSTTWKWSIAFASSFAAIVMSMRGTDTTAMLAEAGTVVIILDVVSQLVSMLGVGLLLALVLAFFGSKKRGYWPEVLSMLPAGVITISTVLILIYASSH